MDYLFGDLEVVDKITLILIKRRSVDIIAQERIEWLLDQLM